MHEAKDANLLKKFGGTSMKRMEAVVPMTVRLLNALVAKTLKAGRETAN